MLRKKNIIISAFQRIKGLMRKPSVRLWEFHRTFSLIAAAPKPLPKRSEAKSFKSRTQQIIWITHTVRDGKGWQMRNGLLDWGLGLRAEASIINKPIPIPFHSPFAFKRRVGVAQFFGHSAFCATSIIKMFGSSSFSSLCVSHFYLV